MVRLVPGLFFGKRPGITTQLFFFGKGTTHLSNKGTWSQLPRVPTPSDAAEGERLGANHLELDGRSAFVQPPGGHGWVWHGTWKYWLIMVSGISLVYQ